jgi:hypothetical protein
VQVDPIKTKLKPPGSTRLKVKRDVPHSIFAFKFKLRRYTKAYYEDDKFIVIPDIGRAVQVEPMKAMLKASGTKRSKL